MTRPIPSLAMTDARCPDCGEPLSFDSPPWCFACHEPGLARREALEVAAVEQLRAIRRDHETARRRARTWQLGRAVQS